MDHQLSHSFEAARDDGLVISDDPARLDVDRICAWLAEAYWSTDRTRATVVRSIAHSLPFGVYTPAGTQVALARVTTDQATFAWVGDVYVDADWRGQGIGGWLSATVVTRLRELGVPRIVLTTRDAHEVYARVGFEPLRVPASWMEIDVRPTRPRPEDVRPSR